MLILIAKDSATQVPREVSAEEAQALADQGLDVLVPTGEGVSIPFKDWVALQPVVEEAAAKPVADPVAEAAPGAEATAPVTVPKKPAAKTTKKK